MPSSTDHDGLTEEIVADNGPRAYEIRTATAAQVDLQQSCIRWTRGKNGRPRVVVLSEVSLLLVQMQMQEHGDGWLFPSPLKKGAPWTHQALGRHLANICREEGLPHTCLKMLRTTFATRAYALGVPSDAVFSKMETTASSTARRANAAINERKER